MAVEGGALQNVAAGLGHIFLGAEEFHSFAYTTDTRYVRRPPIPAVAVGSIARLLSSASFFFLDPSLRILPETTHSSSYS